MHVHTASAKRRGLSERQIEALKDPGVRRREDLFSARERAILRFTDLLATYPGNMQPSDLEDLGAQLDQDEVFDLVMTIATASWTSKMNDGLQTPVPDDQG